MARIYDPVGTARARVDAALNGENPAAAALAAAGRFAVARMEADAAAERLRQAAQPVRVPQKDPTREPDKSARIEEQDLLSGLLLVAPERFEGVLTAPPGAWDRTLRGVHDRVKPDGIAPSTALRERIAWSTKVRRLDAPTLDSLLAAISPNTLAGLRRFEPKLRETTVEVVEGLVSRLGERGLTSYEVPPAGLDEPALRTIDEHLLAGASVLVVAESDDDSQRTAMLWRGRQHAGDGAEGLCAGPVPQFGGSIHYGPRVPGAVEVLHVHAIDSDADLALALRLNERLPADQRLLLPTSKRHAERNRGLLTQLATGAKGEAAVASVEIPDRTIPERFLEWVGATLPSDDPDAMACVLGVFDAVRRGDVELPAAPWPEHSPPARGSWYRRVPRRPADFRQAWAKPLAHLAQRGDRLPSLPPKRVRALHELLAHVGVDSLAELRRLESAFR